jgi:flagellar basal-body rod protein FlgB
MINFSDALVSPGVEDLLSWTSKRQQALAANIANLDTPGYRAKDYSFDQQLATIDLAATSSQHMIALEDTNPAQLYEVDTRVKQNGNNVDLEREMKEITKNALQYITVVQYLNQKIKTLRTAISGGGN